MRPFVLPLLASLLFLSRAATAQEPSCAVDRHAGFTDQDAEAVEQVLCPELVGVAFGFQTVSVHGADGTGAGASAEAGVDFLRTHKFGGAVALRLDMPLFAVDQTDSAPGSYGSYYGPTRTTVHHYQAPVVSAGVAMRF